MMGTSTQAYGEAWYWDNRYSNEPATFDWYQKYPSLAPLINLYSPRRLRPRVLVIGCGNSAFSEGLVDDGYEDVVNIDISSVVIEAMRTKYSDRPKMKYLQMDVRDMSTFQAASFNTIIDKGTLDSILCGSSSRQNATKMLEEVWRYGGVRIFVDDKLYRVLKDKGVYFLVTYGSPVYRLRLLKESCSWAVKLHVIGKYLSEGTSGQPIWELTKPVPLDEEGSSSLEAVLGKNPDVHYIYVCTKDESLKPDSTAS